MKASSSASERENGAPLMATPVAGRDALPTLLGDGQSVGLRYSKEMLDEFQEASKRRIVTVAVGDASGKEYRVPYLRG